MSTEVLNTKYNPSNPAANKSNTRLQAPTVDTVLERFHGEFVGLPHVRNVSVESLQSFISSFIVPVRGV